MTNWDMAQIDLAELAHKASSGWGQTPSPRLGPTEGQTDRCHRPHLVLPCSTPTLPSPLTAASARFRRRLPPSLVANGPDLADLHRHPSRFARLAALLPNLGNPSSPVFSSLPAAAGTTACWRGLAKGLSAVLMPPSTRTCSRDMS
jgi:hypothetical protein